MITSRILGVALALAGALCLYLYIGKASAERRAAKFETQLVQAEADIRRQNDAIDQLKADGDRMRADAEAARREGDKAIQKARKQAGKVRNTPANGCSTPPEVMGADL